MLLEESGIQVRQIMEPKVEIQNQDLSKIANFAAKEVAGNASRPILVEDSGLFIKVLKGFPGPYSSYVRKTIGLEGILQLVNVTDKRQAYFQSTVAARLPNQMSGTFSARVYGTISHRAVGSHGFGFDPIFVPRGSRRTFGQMTLSEKNRYSHRGLAFRKFAAWFLDRA